MLGPVNVALGMVTPPGKGRNLMPLTRFMPLFSYVTASGPVAGGNTGAPPPPPPPAGVAVVVRVSSRPSVGQEPSAHRVVQDRREHHGFSGLPQDLNDAADTVFDF